MRSKYYDKDKAREYVYRYRAKNIDKSRRWIRESYARNAEKRREYARKQRAKIQNDPVLRRLRNERDRIRGRVRELDENFRLYKRIKTRMLMALKRNYKVSRTTDLLGCSIESCRKYLESKWLTGMSWKNHGKRGWHIDHVIPCASFDLSDPIQQGQCFHHTNLQPLWSEDNWKKGSSNGTKTNRKPNPD